MKNYEAIANIISSRIKNVLKGIPEEELAQLPLGDIVRISGEVMISTMEKIDDALAALPKKTGGHTSL